MVASGNGSASLVAAYYLRPPQGTRGQPLTAPDLARSTGVAQVPASGDVDGDGQGEFVVGLEAAGGRTFDDELAVYRMAPRQSPARIATVSAFDRRGGSDSGNLLVGNVIPSEPGDEIVIGEDGNGRRASQIRVFGGLGGGQLRLMRRVRVLSAGAAAPEPLRFALGNVSTDADHPGLEIVVGDQRGYVHVFSVASARRVRLQRTPVLADIPGASARVLAVGDLLPGLPGDEIAVADGEGLVRIVNGRTGAILLEFVAFDSPTPAPGSELWIGDVIASLPGAELIVGQGAAGGQLRVFSLATGVPIPLFAFPDSPSRPTTLARHLVIGDLLPNLPGNEVAVVQPPARVVEVFRLEKDRAEHCTTVDTSEFTDPIGAIAVGRWW